MKQGLFDVKITFDGVPVVHEQKVRGKEGLRLAHEQLELKFGKGGY